MNQSEASVTLAKPAPARSYSELERRFRRLALINEARAMLHWDWATMMPAGGADARGEQLAELSVIAHEQITDPALSDLLDQADAEACRLSAWQRANLREMRREWRHAAALPSDLIEARSRATSVCEMIWREARPANDFARLVPSLNEVVHLTREIAVAKSELMACTPYDALLDRYEPDGRAAEIDVLFADLAKFLPDFTERALDHQRRQVAPLPIPGPFPVDQQRALSERLMATLGFPFHQGRLDLSHHPFSGGNPDDLRITTRYDENDFATGLMAVLHETGHALYEFGLPRDWRYQPVGTARGMSIHESQSLLVEMQACRSREFLGFAAPLIREAFGQVGPAWTDENLFRLNTLVAPGLIRVDADEVTYPSHVIMRYRLERAIIDGDLAIADLPGAWHQGMAELLGLTPPDDRDGCMQDIHWVGGDFGYFPTYTLGAMTAAQLFATAKEDDPAIMAGLGVGDFRPLFAWLKTHVHGLGSSLSGAEMLTRATGQTLTTEVFKRHLTERYLAF